MTEDQQQAYWKWKENVVWGDKHTKCTQEAFEAGWAAHHPDDLDGEIRAAIYNAGYTAGRIAVLGEQDEERKRTLLELLARNAPLAVKLGNGAVRVPCATCQTDHILTEQAVSKDVWEMPCGVYQRPTRIAPIY